MPPPAPRRSLSTEGQSFTATVASGLFTSGCQFGECDHHLGDGTTSPGADDGNNGIRGTHTYGEEQTSYSGSVAYAYKPGTVSCPPHQPATFQAVVSDAALSASGRTLTGSQGQALSGVVAQISDANGGGQASDFAAQIQWGVRQHDSGQRGGRPERWLRYSREPHLRKRGELCGLGEHQRCRWKHRERVGHSDDKHDDHRDDIRHDEHPGATAATTHHPDRRPGSA